MELATMPQSSSAISAAADESSAQQTQTSPHSLKKNQQGNAKKPRKSASDTRVNDTPAPTTREGLEYRQRHPSDDEYQTLKYGASHVIHLFVPVSLCMAVVIMTIMSVGFYSESNGEYLPYTPFHPDKADDTGMLVTKSLGNALVMLGFVVIMTVVLILLYYYRFYKVIHGWLIFSTLAMLTGFTISYIVELFKNYNISVDYLSVAFFVWNWLLVGMICIHWKGPLLLQQFYLVAVSALMALTFIKYLPEWSVWTVLGVLAIWDLVAVLCPKGPLRILVETAQERNEPIFPALIYSSGVIYSYVMYGTFMMTATTEPESKHHHSAERQHHNSEVQTVNADQRQPEASRDGSASSADGLLAAVGTSSEGDKQLRERTSQRFTQASRGRGAGSSAGDSAHTSLVTTATVSGSAHPRTAINSSSSGQQSPRHPASERGTGIAATGGAESTGGRQMVVEERGIKLGLGDFIFYSVLVGKASSYGDWNAIIACYVSILVGLAFTLMLLALFRKALPALPISIFAGIIFFFAARFFITPFMSAVTTRQLLL